MTDASPQAVIARRTQTFTALQDMNPTGGDRHIDGSILVISRSPFVLRQLGCRGVWRGENCTRHSLKVRLCNLLLLTETCRPRSSTLAYFLRNWLIPEMLQSHGRKMSYLLTH